MRDGCNFGRAGWGALEAGKPAAIDQMGLRDLHVEGKSAGAEVTQAWQRSPARSPAPAFCPSHRGTQETSRNASSSHLRHGLA